ncbi:30S ribosomal protein S6 domain protein, partial [Peptostreptococcaceae bacterium oral taxon 113 str. W5053]
VVKLILPDGSLFFYYVVKYVLSPNKLKVIKRVFDVICQNFNRREPVFFINTQYLGLLTFALHNHCKIKGYSIQFQSQHLDVTFCDSVFTSYHWEI